MTATYVQYGCGTCAPEGWANFDASLRLRIENLPGVRAVMGRRVLFPANVRYGDILAGLPVPDGTVDGLYCSHTLEHIHRASIGLALRNSFRLLKPGGVFRLIVPDLRWRIEAFLADAADPHAADTLQDGLHFRPRARPSGVMGRMRAVFGLSMHQWMYDEKLMVALLAAQGFVGIRRCRFGDSGDPMFDRVEDRTRFEVGAHHELALECRRPRGS